MFDFVNWRYKNDAPEDIEHHFPSINRNKQTKDSDTVYSTKRITYKRHHNEVYGTVKD